MSGAYQRNLRLFDAVAGEEEGGNGLGRFFHFPGRSAWRSWSGACFRGFTLPLDKVFDIAFDDASAVAAPVQSRQVDT